jgi:hypothetical protein
VIAVFRVVAAVVDFLRRLFAGAVSAFCTRRWMVRRVRSTALLATVDPRSVNFTT